MATNYSAGFNNITSPEQVLTQMNNNTNNLIGIGGLWAVFLTLLVIMLNAGHGAKKSFAAASYPTFILSWLMFLGGWIGSQWLIVFLVLVVVSTISLFINNE